MRKPYTGKRRTEAVDAEAAFEEVRAVATKILNNIRKHLEQGYTVEMKVELVSPQSKLFAISTKFHGVTTSRVTLGVSAANGESRVWGNINGQPQGPFEALDQLVAAIKRDQAWLLR